MTGSPTITTSYEHTVNTYSVTIAGLAGLTGLGPNDGGTVDEKSQPYYSAFSSSLSLALDKERANMRYEQIVLNLEYYATILRIYNWVATGATQDAPATAFSFYLVFDLTDYVIYPPQPSFTDLQAIARLVAIALSQSYTETRTYYDPSVVTTPSGTGTKGETEAIVTAGAMGGGSVATVEAQITVVQIA